MGIHIFHIRYERRIGVLSIERIITRIVAPYEMGEHDHNELLTSLNTLENIITEDGNVDTTEIERSRDMDSDAWEDENENVVPSNPNIRGGETDPRILDSENAPVSNEFTDEDTFTRIARSRGY